MRNPAVILAIVAMVAIAAGLALGFFELTALGLLAAIASLAVGVKRRPTRHASGR